MERLIDPVGRRRMIWAVLLVALLAWLFWTQSRYPSLDEKAMMSGAIQLEDPLSFEAMIPLSADDPALTRIAVSTVNWVDTNRKGMTFGVLFAAAFLTLLGYLRRRNFKGPFANAFYGMALGAPLGVCVNCAAPIAKGLYSGGSRAETTLAAMIASPTLNIVVLTMAFSLLPFYIAVTKLVLSLAVILIAVPVLCRFLPPERLQVEVPAEIRVPQAPEPVDGPVRPESYLASAGRFLQDFGRNLWFIVRTTVPLMLLAGFLGAVVATLFPADVLSGQPFGVLGLAFAALVGTFLPVPIGFDVVVSGALLNGGVSQGYIMTLVFTLGSFSIYSFFVIATSVGLRAAAMLGGVIMAVGLLAGLGAQAYHTHQTQRALDMLTAAAAQIIPAAQAAEPDQIIGGRDGSAVSVGVAEAEGVELTLTSTPFNPRSAAAERPFTRLEAWHLGIDKPLEFSFADMWPPFWEGRSISAGDINRDGYPDLVLASTEAGLYVYANDGTGRFSDVTPPLGVIADEPVLNAALVDIDNDGWLDLFLSGYQTGLSIIPNIEGSLRPDLRRTVTNREDALLALALSFGDVDADGDLDVALGNWAAGWYRRIPGEESRNRILFNSPQGLDGSVYADLPGIPGETLSILFSDLDQDGRLDLMAGNDFEVPDDFYFGDGQGGFDAVTRQQDRIEHSTNTTMALKSADLDNDGRFEIYAAQIAGRADGVSRRLQMRPIAEYCTGIERPDDLATCEQNIEIKRWYRSGHSFDPGYADRCARLEGRYNEECRAMLVKDLAIQNQNPEICSLVPVSQPRARQLCEIHFRPSRVPTRDEEEAAIPQIMGENVLLVADAEGRYADQARERGVEVGGWSWDVKIADFDNDGWQDIYIVNGTWVPNEVTPSNIFLHNNGDGHFSGATDGFGLADYLMTAAAVSLDVDRDGDLDLITIPVNGPTMAFINNSQSGQAIAFALVDELGNRDGIGARVEVWLADGGRQIRELQSGGGFMSFDEPVAYFGLGDASEIDRVLVHWPDGGVSVVEDNLAAGALYTLHRHAVATGRNN